MINFCFVILRLIGVILSLGILTGIIWFFHDRALIEIISPIFLLFMLSVFSSKMVQRFFVISTILTGASFYVFFTIGIPFIETFYSFTQISFYVVHWVLIILFLFKAYLEYKHRSLQL